MSSFINVIIAEDEDIIRNGLVNSVPWNDLGYEVVGVASNGKEALACYQSTKADLIVTDIKMPFLDGLELLEKLVECGSTSKVIIISGYDEFNYAQKALKLGAYDYILKPIKFDNFVDLLSRLHTEFNEIQTKNKLIEAAKRADSNKQLLDALCESDPVIHQGYTRALLGSSYYSVVLLQLDSFDLITSSFDYLQLRELDSEFETSLTSLFGSEGFIIAKRRLGELIVVIIDEQHSSLEHKINIVENYVLNNNQTGFSLSASFSGIKDSPAKLNEAYGEAITINEHRFVLDSDKILHYESLSTKTKMRHDFIEVNENQLTILIQSGDHSEIQKWFSHIQDQIRAKNIKSYFQTVIVVSNIYYDLMRSLANRENEMVRIYMASSNAYAKIINQKSADDMINKMSQIVMELADLIANDARGKYSDSFAKAKQYVLDHYADPNLTLEVVAEYAAMGACYLSSMFKQKTDSTFIEFLTSLRMKKALDLLLNTDLLVYEISEQVGYQNPTYFSTVFKRYYSKTPKDFRDKG